MMLDVSKEASAVATLLSGFNTDLADYDTTDPRSIDQFVDDALRLAHRTH